MGADPYASSAPYIDPLIAGFWYGIAPALVDELRTLRADIGPVVDIGAGSGRGVRVIHDALPDAPVLAVEPSVPMRAALLARLADDPLLGDRVTVTASDALDCPLPDRMRAAVCMNMLGHLAPDERRSFWRRLARRLAPGERSSSTTRPRRPRARCGSPRGRPSVSGRRSTGAGRRPNPRASGASCGA
ncbi:class I SAM-dependent methyltransferase [Streptomyces sp. RFCAC02]|uniref:class I SAM-dependent methyltransferase n=1 Tax=Streptomyces sp. RFCAC02 TaxID=2499143 RepID=UPI0019D06D7F|nr:class I SAM-dependent methyltransferase [Streptomyces sp. RFCAC02]